MLHSIYYRHRGIDTVSNLHLLLQDERRQLEQELEGVRSCISSDQARLTEIIHRLRHVNALLGDGEMDGPTNGGSSGALASTLRAEMSSATDMAAKVLSERKKEPMYYKDLAHEVIKRGVHINGAEPGATLVAKLVHDERFIRPISKGFYALRKDYPNARNVGAKSKTTRRRRRSS